MRVFKFFIFLIIAASEMMEFAAGAAVPDTMLWDSGSGSVSTLDMSGLCDFKNYPLIDPETNSFSFKNAQYQLKCIFSGIAYQQPDLDNCLDRANKKFGEITRSALHDCLQNIKSFE